MVKKKLLLRIGRQLHESVKLKAHLHGMSINSFLERLIARALLSSDDISTVTTRLIAEASAEFQDNLIGMLLFGSQARGDSHDQSDVDLLVVLTRNVRINRTLYRDWELKVPHNYSIHFSYLPERDTEPGSLWLECALDGKVVCDPDRKLSSTLQAIKLLIASGQFVRHTTHGQGYWVPR